MKAPRPGNDGARATRSGARICIVECNDITRAGLRSVLNELTLTNVIGEATSALEAIKLCRTERPDVVLVNLALRDSNGTALIGQLRAASPRSAIVVVTADDDPQSVIDAIQAGASGYLLLGVRSAELAEAVDRAVAGESFVDPVVAGRVVQVLAAGSGLGIGASRPTPLTARELEVLQAIAHGRSNKEIATDLDVAPGTAKVHVERILRKLVVSNRAEATMRAVQLGLLDTTRPDGGSAPWRIVVDSSRAPVGGPGRRWNTFFGRGDPAGSHVAPHRRRASELD